MKSIGWCKSKTLNKAKLQMILIAITTMNLSNAYADILDEETPLLPASTMEETVIWTGRVAGVTANGDILLEDGVSFRQWAVNITDISAASAFLVGREVRCRAVSTPLNSATLLGHQGDAGIFDCDVYPKVWSKPQSMGDLLSLYAWSSDLGFGQIGCEERDRMPIGVISVQHIVGYNYQCRGKESLRQLPSE